ncbi:MAG: hypothetical protein ACYCW6_26550 [Candidatus Xenobia bacterium]
MINPYAPNNFGALQKSLQSELAKLGDANDPTLQFMTGINWGVFDPAGYDAGSGGGGWGAVASLLAPFQGMFNSEQSYINSLPGMNYVSAMNPFMM